MPTIDKRAFAAALTERELPDFVAWATTRAGFRAGATEHAIPELGGAYHYGRIPQSLEDLVERWRSLGCPAPYRPRRGGARAPGYHGRPQGSGAARGAARREEG